MQRRQFLQALGATTCLVALPITLAKPTLEDLFNQRIEQFWATKGQQIIDQLAHEIFSQGTCDPSSGLATLLAEEPPDMVLAGAQQFRMIKEAAYA